jgi:uncharacterized Zn-binding protein involved in type VI secretion
MAEIASLGHLNSENSPAAEGSPNVFINGVSVLRVGDHFADGSEVVAGAPYVFINGKPAARLGDPVSDGGQVAQGSPLVRIGNAGGEAFGKRAAVEGLRSMLQDKLTEKDNLLLCIPHIALAEYERANERDKPGWALFHEEIIKWLSKPAYIIDPRNKYDNGGQEPSWVAWDWLMGYERFQKTVTGILKPEYLFGPLARVKLAEILESEGAFASVGQSFDHTVLDWDKLRSYAFQSLPMDSYKITWLAYPELKPDGLTVIGQLTLFAAAKGSTQVNAGKRTICVDAVGLFIHDGFEFAEDQWLGNWDCKSNSFSLSSFINGWVENSDFREFRERTGYGCDFRTMNKPAIYSVDKFCYDTII